MDEELLDAQLSDAESRIADLEIHLLELQREWEEVYPYETLEKALTTITRLVDKLLDHDPEDLEAQALMVEAEVEITPKLQEPEVFYLA